MYQILFLKYRIFKLGLSVKQKQVFKRSIFHHTCVKRLLLKTFVNVLYPHYIFICAEIFLF